MDQKMTAMDRLEAISNVLEKLADIPAGGKLKCGYVWIMNDLLNGLHNDILVYEDKLKMYEGEKTEVEKPKVESEEE